MSNLSLTSVHDQNKSHQILREIFAPQLEFKTDDKSEKFLETFCELYRIELFKDGLDLILTKLQEKDLRFEVNIINGWNTRLGCYLTEQSKVFNKILGTFSKVVKKKIILHDLSHYVLAHEMAHALEFESGLNLGEEFRKAIGLDMKDRQPSIITLKAQSQSLMVDALKAYPPEQFLSELFARYFELLSVSRNVCATGNFATEDVMASYAHTTNLIENAFNPQIKPQIDSEIAKMTNEIVKRVKTTESAKTFQGDFQKRTAPWSKGVKSNSSWQESWQKYQKIEEDKK